MSTLSCQVGLSRSLRPMSRTRSQRSTFARCSSSIFFTTPEEQERQWAEKLTNGKAAMIQLGYHGPSLWTQVICWGDHDQVSF